MMAENWKEYQEQAAELFRSIGLDAETDIPVQGVRTVHNVDVFVEIELAGWTVKWVVECKYWNTRVSKLHVLALRQIVSDVGADRGILLCESGFQSGAIEAANLTNVRVSSLADLERDSREDVALVKLRDLFDRNLSSRERYWDIPKDIRIENGLRPGFGGEPIYSGDRVTQFTEKYLGLAFRGVYPIYVDEFDGLLLGREMPRKFESAEHTYRNIEPLVSELESKLATILDKGVE